MEAAKALDAVSLLPGMELSQSDAHSAYAQTFLGGTRGGGTPTWVSIPRHRWLKSWEGNYQEPLVRLVLALYGHVDAGTHWEDYCTEKVLECGWEKISILPSTFYHPKKHAFMIVYVDDFKLAYNTAHAKELWRDLWSKIRLSDPEPPCRFLGCYQTKERMKVKDLAQYLENHPSLHPRSSTEKTPLRLGVPEKRATRTTTA